MLRNLFYLLSCVLFFGLYPAVGSGQWTLNDSLQLHYPLDTGTNDLSGNGYHGTLYNAVPTTDRYGNDSSAFSFDGSGDWIDSETTFDYQFRTVGLWFQMSSLSSSPMRVLLSHDANTLTYGAFASAVVGSSLNARAGGTGAVTVSSSIQISTWYHMTLVRDGSAVRYYLNGELISTGTSNSSGSVTGANDELVIGVHRTENQRWHHGKIDDFRVYNRALEEWEIQNLFCNVDAAISVSDTTVDQGTSLTFYNDSSNATGTQTWLVDGDTIISHPSMTWTFPQPGTYQIILSATEGFCEQLDTVTVTVDEIMGLDSIGCLTLDHFIKISDTSSVMSTGLGAGDNFGWGINPIGDVDGDGVIDMAVGAPYDDDGGTNTGAAYVLFMNADGTVDSYQKISDTQGSFTATLNSTDNFGHEVYGPGDMNNDGIPDLFVSAVQDDDGGTDRGAIYLLYLNSNGTVSDYVKLSSTSGGGITNLSNGDKFGQQICTIGDLDGDGVNEIAVGANLSSEGGTERGSVHIFFLDTADTIVSQIELSNQQGTFSGNTINNMRVGTGVFGPGDLNGDGIPDLIIGAVGNGSGDVMICYLNSDGSVASYTELDNTVTGLSGVVQSGSRFGRPTKVLGWWNGDLWMLVGAWHSDINGTNDGAAYLIQLDTGWNVLSVLEISDDYTPFTGNLDNNDQFGIGASLWDDVNGDGIPEIVFGSRKDDDGGTDAGAIYVMFFDNLCCQSTAQALTQDTVIEVGTNLLLEGTADNPDSVRWELNGSVLSYDTAFTESFDQPGAFNVLFIMQNGACSDTDTVFVRVLPEPSCLVVDSAMKISDTSGEFYGILDNLDILGMGLRGAGDLNNDGVPDIIASAPGDDDGGANYGALYVLYMDDDGTVASHLKISNDSGGLGSGLGASDFFGASISIIDDLDGDSIPELAVGSPYDDDGGGNRGAVYILFLDSNEEVSSKTKISDTQGSLVESLGDGDRFGTSICSIGDLNGDGVGDIMVGMPVDDVSSTDDGSVMVLFLNSSGSVIDEQKIADGTGNFPASISSQDRFGGSCSSLGDFDEDGYLEVAIGIQLLDISGSSNVGGFYIVSLDTNGTVVDAVLTTEGLNGFEGPLDPGGAMGTDLQLVGDVNGDGYLEMVVANWMSDEGGSENGAFWLLSLDSTGYVFSEHKVSSDAGTFPITIGTGDRFGMGVTQIGDLNGDGLIDLAAGAREDDDGGAGRGAVYVMTLRDTCCLLNANFDLDETDICIGGSITATNTSQFGSGSTSYAWFINDSLVNTSTNLNYTFSAAGNYDIELQANDSCIRLHSETVTVHPDPVADAGTSQFICFGDTAQLNASGGVSYSWSSGASLSNDTVSDPLAFPSTTTIYFLTITDQYGCTDDDNVAIIVNTLPTVTVSGDSLICSGDSTTLTAGGTTGVTYSWSPNTALSSTTGSTVVAYPTVSTTYVVEGEDANGCIDTASITVMVDTSLAASIASFTNVSCFNGNDGSATASVSGGTTPYSYLWSSGSTSLSASGLTAGTVSFTVTDNDGCTDTISQNITEPDSLEVTLGTTNVACFGESSGAVSASVSGGTSPYSYSWNTSGTTASIAFLPAGAYTVTVTDANGCSTFSSTTVNEPSAALDASITASTNVSCFGGNDGQATAGASGGTSPYSYNWSSGATSATANGLSAGTFTVTVTDANGCSDTAEVTLSQPAALALSISVDSNVSCNGGNDGSATAAVSGGTSPYSYSWSAGSSSATQASLSAGTYTLTVTDDNGCSIIQNVTITEPTTLSISTSVAANVSCNGGNDGSASASASGGTSPYSYLWSTGATSTSITGLSADTYTVTTTDDKGCTSSGTVTITEPNVLVATATLVQDVSCFGGSDGSVSVSATGGTTAYSYLWSNGATTATNAGLSAGTYTVTVTDANGCSDTGTATVNEPAAALDASISSSSDVSCFGGNDGSSSASATGGTSPYSYSWSSGATTSTATSLSAGTYTVTITDANGCSDTAEVTILQPALLAIVTNIDSMVSCFGGSDASITASSSGGTSPYSYAWSAGSSTSVQAGLSAGSYAVTVTDANGCQDSATNIIITQPDSLIATASLDQDVSCFGGTDGAVSSSVIGGTTPYSYAWSNGGTTAGLSSLPAGTYTLTLTDDKGCTDTSSVVVSEPSLLVASIDSSENVSCNGGSDGAAYASAAGGTTPYSFSWSSGSSSASAITLTAGTYTVTVTDANGCTDTAEVTITEPTALTSTTTFISANLCFGDSNGSASVNASGGTPGYTYLWGSGETTATATELWAGTRSVTVTDTNGCTTTNSVVVTEPTPVDAIIDSSENVICNGFYDGAVYASAAGGVGNYSFVWSSGETTPSIDSLTSGTYVIAVFDSNGCMDTAMATVIELDPILPNVSDVDVTCFDGSNGSASSAVTGGGTTFTYLWSNGATSTGLTALSAGIYTLTITDENDCYGIDSAVVTEPDSITFAFDIQDISCFGSGDGSVTVNAMGGTMPYSYLWSTGSTDTTISGLTEGWYSVTLTDSNGCQNEDSAFVFEPTVLTSATSLIDSVSCFGLSDGSGMVSPVGGVGNYSFLWSNGSTDDTLSNVSAGTYYVTVTDSNGCTTMDSVTILEPALLQVQLDSLADVTCYNAANGALAVSFTGGNDTVSYQWSNASISNFVFSLDTGDYTVTITDVNGCQDSATYSITQPDTAVYITAATIYNAYCLGGEVGSIVVEGAGGTGPYAYAWNSGNVGDSISGLGAGTYVVTVTDSLGCTHDTSFTVNEPSSVDTADISVSNALCFGDSTGSMTASFVGGTGPYSYTWSNSVYTATNAGLSSGTYSVTIYDVDGCYQIAEDSVGQPEELIVSTSILSSPLCFGDSTGSIVATVTGGIQPYNLGWSTGASSDTVFNLPAGSYAAIVIDSNGCVDSAVSTITQPTPLTFDTLWTWMPSCYGFSNGSINQVTNGGTAPYTYSWSNGTSSPTADSLSAGTYQVTVTDSNNCTLDTSVVLGQPDTLIATITVISAANCSNSNDGSLAVVSTGGTPSYSYVWNTGATSDTLGGIGTGDYHVTVTDSNGCVDSTTLFLPFIHEPPLTGLNATEIFCDEDTAMLSALPGEVSYAWNNGATTPNTLVTQSGTYIVTVTSGFGCVSIDTTEVEFANSTPVTLGNDTIVCAESGVEFITLFTVPNIFASYDWSTGDSSATIQASSTGIYKVTVTNGAGCTSSDQINVVFDTCINIGIADLMQGEGLRLYPNPTRGQVTIEWAEEHGAWVDYVLLSTHGELVERKRTNAQRVAMDLQGVAAGVYFLRVEAEGSVRHFRLIRQ